MAAKRKRSLSTPPIDSDGDEDTTQPDHQQRPTDASSQSTRTPSFSSSLSLNKDDNHVQNGSPPKSPWHSKLQKTRTISNDSKGDEDDYELDSIDAIVEQRNDNKRRQQTISNRTGSVARRSTKELHNDDDLIDFATSMDNAPITPPSKNQLNINKHTSMRNQSHQIDSSETTASRSKRSISLNHISTSASSSSTVAMSNDTRSETHLDTGDAEIQDILAELAEDVTQEMIEENMELLRQLQSSQSSGKLISNSSDDISEDCDEATTTTTTAVGNKRRKLPFWMDKTHSAGVVSTSLIFHFHHLSSIISPLPLLTH